jgi:hypothetical protein
MSSAASPVKVKLHAHPRPTGAYVFAQAPAERNMEIFASLHVKERKFFRSLRIPNQVKKSQRISCLLYGLATAKKVFIIFNSNNEREREG